MPKPFAFADSDMQGTEGALGGPDVRRRIPIKLLPKQARSKGCDISLIDTPRTSRRNSCFYFLHSAMLSVIVMATLCFLLTESFAYKQEERFDCGVKAGDAYASQRRYPQPLFWDYKV